MSEAMIMTIVATECSPEKEAEFNKWYNEVHVPLIFKFKGNKKVTRYRLVDTMGEDKGQVKYLACYEYESPEALDAFAKSPELAAAMAEMEETWKDGGFEIKWRAVYEPLKVWKR